jgi:hypothetical protein
MASIYSVNNNCILIDNILVLFCVSQPPDTFKKIANCVNYKIKLKQSNFERNAKNILGFEHFSPQIHWKKLPLKNYDYFLTVWEPSCYCKFLQTILAQNLQENCQSKQALTFHIRECIYHACALWFVAAFHMTGCITDRSHISIPPTCLYMSYNRIFRCTSRTTSFPIARYTTVIDSLDNMAVTFKRPWWIVCTRAWHVRFRWHDPRTRFRITRAA